MTLKEQQISDLFDTEHHNSRDGSKVKISLLIAIEKACHPDASLDSKMRAFEGMCILVDSVRGKV